MTELFSAAGFFLRLLALREREGIQHWNKFEEEIGMKGAISRWKTGNDKPNPESLLKIRARFKVSIDWLLSGEESPASLAESQPDYEVRPLAPMEADLFKQVMAKVSEVLHTDKKTLSMEQEAGLITRVYNDCAEDRIKPDAARVRRYLWVIMGSSER